MNDLTEYEIEKEISFIKRNILSGADPFDYISDLEYLGSSLEEIF